MFDIRLAALFTAFGFVLASLAGSLSAAPDKTLGMALMSAAVNSSGLLTGGAGATTAEKSGPQGQYSVWFKRPVPGCRATATISGPGPTGDRGFIAISISSNNLFNVRTYDHSGDLADRPFNMIVFCAE